MQLFCHHMLCQYIILLTYALYPYCSHHLQCWHISPRHADILTQSLAPTPGKPELHKLYKLKGTYLNDVELKGTKTWQSELTELKP